MNGERFQHCIDNLYAIVEEQEPEVPVIVLNNAPVHNGVVCEATIRKLPAYSPFLYVIENCLSVFKLKLRETLRKPQIVQGLTVVPHVIAIEHCLRVPPSWKIRKL